jgi:Ser/Thr protein kinase RdoA (MazF antagonist)
VLLSKVSLDGGSYVLKLCHECRETTTIAELELMRSKCEDWFTELDIEVTLKRASGESLATIKDRLSKKRVKRRR